MKLLLLPQAKKSTINSDGRKIESTSLKSDHNHVSEALLPYKEDHGKEQQVGRRVQTKSFSDESTCSINSHNSHNQDDELVFYTNISCQKSLLIIYTHAFFEFTTLCECFNLGDVLFMFLSSGQWDYKISYL